MKTSFLSSAEKIIRKQATDCGRKELDNDRERGSGGYKSDEGMGGERWEPPSISVSIRFSCARENKMGEKELAT